MTPASVTAATTGSRGLILLTGLAAAVLAGALTSIEPISAVAFIALALLVLSAVAQGVTARLHAVLLTVALIGYAFAGRGFAYLGPGTLLGGQRYAPPYVGEFVLILSISILLFRFTGARRGFPEIAIVLLCVLGALRTLPYIGTYGLDALRDATLWAYSLIGLAVAVVSSPRTITTLLRLYSQLAPGFLIWVPAIFAIATLAPAVIPTFAFGLPLVDMKSGDMGVHLAGIAAFMVLGLKRGRLPHPAWWAAWAVGAGIVAATNRGGLVAIFASMSVVVVLRPTTRLIHMAGGAGVVIAVALLLAPSGGTTARTLSVEQVISNVTSVFVEATGPGLEGTKQYRLAWWGKIVHYGILGRHVLTGKGFGVNLADDDGFQVREDGTLRAPHNTHLTVVARMGLPGLLIWIAIIGSLLAGLAHRALDARKRGRDQWSAIFVWIAAYLVAMLVNTMFDPYLEGPQGAIWFWALAGLAIACCRIYDTAGIDASSGLHGWGASFDKTNDGRRRSHSHGSGNRLVRSV